MKKGFMKLSKKLLTITLAAISNLAFTQEAIIEPINENEYILDLSQFSEEDKVKIIKSIKNSSQNISPERIDFNELQDSNKSGATTF